MVYLNIINEDIRNDKPIDIRIYRPFLYRGSDDIHNNGSQQDMVNAKTFFLGGFRNKEDIGTISKYRDAVRIGKYRSYCNNVKVYFKIDKQIVDYQDLVKNFDKYEAMVNNQCMEEYIDVL